MPTNTKKDGSTMQEQKSIFPANPIYYNNTDSTIWSYITFGCYPQTEVTGEALTPKIIGNCYDQNGDAWITGTKYRRISREDTSDNEYFGKNDFRYFKWESIRWRVLQNDGKTLFVMADKGLDSRAFNVGYDWSITWENCTLRTWLNNDFYNMAFDDEEQKIIVLQDVSNAPDPINGHRNSGNDTKDKIYLLSITEVTNQTYGFCENLENTERKLSMDSKSRMMKTSDYAHAMGAWICTDDRKYKGNCKWWLRTSCKYTKDGAMITKSGGIFDIGYHTYILRTAVVPTMHIKLESDRWSTIELPDDEKPKNPTICPHIIYL